MKQGYCPPQFILDELACNSFVQLFGQRMAQMQYVVHHRTGGVDNGVYEANWEDFRLFAIQHEAQGIQVGSSSVGDLVELGRVQHYGDVIYKGNVGKLQGLCDEV